MAELARRRFGIEGIFAVVALAGVAAMIALLVKMALEPRRVQGAGAHADKTAGRQDPGDFFTA